MHGKPLLLTVAFLLVVGTATVFAAFQTGNSYHGFKLLEKRFVDEVNAECLLFEHEKSGARVLKIAADDPNKTFSIGFKTIPQSDAGTPHIMEHSVLNGSKNFPVKSPFDVLLKGSLNTFLNAMTGSDVTIYPVASMNEKDYFNLMHVYLDAVFYPRIYDDPRILKQEGWHHELAETDGEVVYKGVVYNEMKGAFSSPSRELYYQAYKHLFPETAYGYSSGGYPQAIPSLTYEDFVDFHRTYYHPSNSYIFLYGDADVNQELEFINETYLSNYERSNKKVEMPVQPSFAAPKQVTAHYSISEEADVEDQTYLSKSYVIGRGDDRALVMALQVLREVLVNSESAPLRLALQDAEIGRDVSSYVDDIKQNVFMITVQNANPEEQNAFDEVIQTTLAQVVRDGLDKEAVEGAINRMEFRLREGDDAQKGLTYNFQALAGWWYANDPFVSLEYEEPLAQVKTALETNYLEQIIQDHMLDNPHALTLVLEPKPGLESEINDAVEAELQEYKEQLTEEQRDALVKETQALIEYQKREDSPEALATIPLLDIQDINPKAEWYDVQEKEITEVPVLHYDEFTNNVVYTRLMFDARVLPQEKIPYTALLAEVMGSMNTTNYTYGDLDNALNIHTGGFSTYLNTYLKERSDEQLVPKFVVSCKSMNSKIDKMMELMAEIINESVYSDSERLEAVLTRHQSRLDARIKSDGLGYARTRLASYFSNDGMFDELTSGVTYYQFVTELVEQYDERSQEIVEHLQEVAALLFTRDNMLVTLTCDDKDVPAFAEQLMPFVETLESNPPESQTWAFDFDKKNEGLLSASKVQYVLQGYDFKKLGHEWDGKMRVLNQVLSRDYLQNTIRVIGGAYGGFSSFSENGQVYFASYRDPNLTETLENYRASTDFIKEFEADDEAMTRFIIGTVARMDRPLTPSEKGNVAVRYHLEGVTQADKQLERDAVLATSPEDIRAMQSLVADILSQDAYCVYGSEEKIKEAKQVFGELVELAQ
mgnify:CR=1 FL=1